MILHYGPNHYWPFPREYSIWNAAVAALQFWIADLEPQTLSNAIEWVYTAFFCSNPAQQVRGISEEVLFGHFMTTLNDASEWELALEDEGYDSGSESLNIPTHQHRTPCLYHVSTTKNLSFRPATPLAHWAHLPHQQSSLSSICHHLTFGDDDSFSTDNSPLHGTTQQSSLVKQQMACHLTDDSFQDITSEEEVEEYFPTAPLDDDVWMEEPVPDRHLCIHKQSQAHGLCSYPWPYSLNQLHSVPEYAPAPQYMDLSNIFDFPDVMTTTSDKDILSPEDAFGCWKWTLVWINLDTQWTPHTWNRINTFVNTDTLCDYRYIYEHVYTVWLWIHVWTLLTCVIMDIHDIKMQPCYLYIHKTQNVYICGTLLELENIMNMSNWTIHTHIGVPEHRYQWTELRIYDNPWSCCHEFTCIKSLISYDTYKWLKCIVIHPAVSISSYKVSINTEQICTVAYTYHCMVLTWWYPTKQNHFSEHSVCFHWSMSRWGNEEPGNYIHIIPMLNYYILSCPFWHSLLQFWGQKRHPIMSIEYS